MKLNTLPTEFLDNSIRNNKTFKLNSLYQMHQTRVFNPNTNLGQLRSYNSRLRDENTKSIDITQFENKNGDRNCQSNRDSATNHRIRKYFQSYDLNTAERIQSEKAAREPEIN